MTQQVPDCGVKVAGPPLQNPEKRELKILTFNAGGHFFILMTIKLFVSHY